jgi:transposase
MVEDDLKRWIGEGKSLEDIARAVGLHPSTVGYWVAKYGLEPVGRERHARRGGLDRATLEALVERDLTVREIAAEVDRSTATVRHWLKRHALVTTGAARRRTPASGVPGDRVPAMCQRHGPTLFVVRSDGTSTCARCRADAVTRRRRKVKRILVDEAGGACALCGYDRFVGALQFHHVDPSTKRFDLSLKGVARALDTVREEARKCVVLCANCHAEVEGGVSRLPVDAMHRIRG